MTRTNDLTTLKIDNTDTEKGKSEQRDYSLGPVNADVEIVFRNQQKRLIEFIGRYDCILGAVAWFTDLSVVNSLRDKKVSIILQKEDFLRPDSTKKQDLLKAYSSVPKTLERSELLGIGSSLSYASGDTDIQPFRCVGNINSAKAPAMPRMHNKFLVGCGYKLNTYGVDPDEGFDLVYGEISPQAVWTGSYNFSYPAQKSFENAIIINNSEVAEAYAKEFSQIFAFSEQLDWHTDWVAPEYRIGT
jgi:hypothetical protein